MRILLDECVPRGLKRHLGSYEVRTTPECGWAGKRNGELLRLADREFDVFLTMDRKLQHQQNLSVFDLAVIVVLARSNSLVHLRPLVPKILGKLPTAEKGCATIVRD